MEQSTNFQLLELDTKLFGFGVAKITKSRLSTEQLQLTLNTLHTQNINLVYWSSDSTDPISQQAAKQFGGFLGSEQITYLLDLTTLASPPITASEIKIYQATTANTELTTLALLASKYSHFNIDPKFPKKLLSNLYNTWIENSVNGSIATRVLITQSNNTITGFITLGEKNSRGDIGLLAIDPNFRGQKLGTKLVRAAQAYFIEKGFSHAQVVTQKANTVACRLYEKCDFYQEKTENYYHFWL